MISSGSLCSRCIEKRKGKLPETAETSGNPQETTVFAVGASRNARESGRKPRKPIGNRRKPLRKPFVFEEVLSENTIFGHTPGSIYITKLKVGSPPPRSGACGSPTTKPARSARILGGGRPRRPVVTIIIAIVTIIIMIVIIKAPGPARAKRRWLEPQLQPNQTPPCV